MRELEFRVWNYEAQSFDYFDLNNLDYTETTIKNALNRSNKQQYIGLKDKTGKKIFEGDILQNNYNDPLVIKWMDNGYWSWYEFTLDNPVWVIGNIYENPELLNAKDRK